MEQFNYSDGHGIYVKTYNPTLKYTFKWLFENYSKIPLDTTENSPKFSIEPQSTWYVKFKKQKNDFTFKIYRNCDILPVEVIYKLTVNHTDGTKCHYAKKECCVNCKEDSKDIAINNCYSWMDTMNLMSKAKNDTLIFTVFIEIRQTRITEVVTCSEDNKDVAVENLQQKLLKTLSDDLNKLLNSRTKPDLELCVQDQKIHVHQAILSMRSPVFAKMLQQDGMSETKLNVVDIDDITMPVLMELVAFLYSGQMKDYEFQSAMDLYYAADKYEVLELREICARVLVSKMTIDDSPNVLHLSELHQDTSLKDEVMKFIKIHYKTQKNSF